MACNSRSLSSTGLIRHMTNTLARTTCLSQQGRRSLCSKAPVQETDDMLTTTLGKKKELEYKVTYPASGDRLFTEDGKRRPVIVLIGWMGGDINQLGKFSAIYQKSYITVRFSTPAVNILRRSHRLPEISERVLREIKKRGFYEHPIFFVPFSNSGSIFYQQISLALQRSGSRPKVKGVIFESALSERRLSRTFLACRVIYKGHPLSLPMSVMDTLVFSFNWCWEEIFRFFGAKDVTTTEPMYLLDEPYKWPQLFLYSSIDPFIPTSVVEKFARERADRAVRTQLVEFENSSHLKHLFIYRDAYIKMVHRFINNCLTGEHEECIGQVRKEIVMPPPSIDSYILPNDTINQGAITIKRIL